MVTNGSDLKEKRGNLKEQGGANRTQKTKKEWTKVSSK